MSARAEAVYCTASPKTTASAVGVKETSPTSYLVVTGWNMCCIGRRHHRECMNEKDAVRRKLRRSAG
ncbi:hypothetical protein IG631_03226 [Alternaria alternata]|nr:hypothetical protein IG631_03226 [Alternaria alternata]